MSPTPTADGILFVSAAAVLGVGYLINWVVCATIYWNGVRWWRNLVALWRRSRRRSSRAYASGPCPRQKDSGSLHADTASL